MIKNQWVHKTLPIILKIFGLLFFIFNTSINVAHPTLHEKKSNKESSQKSFIVETKSHWVKSDVFKDDSTYAIRHDPGPGYHYWLVITFKMKQGWHTYKNDPNKPALSPKIMIDLPKDCFVGTTYWSTATLIADAQDVNAQPLYGHEKEFHAAVPVYYWPSDQQLPDAKIKMIVCSNVCKPLMFNLDPTLTSKNEIKKIEKILDTLPINEKKINTILWIDVGLMILFALAGGMILNLMPCVLPVLSLKILGLTKEKTHARQNALYFALGNLLAFLALGSILMVLQLAGHSFGWGFQLQNPVFVVGLVSLFWLMGLNLFGIFEIGASLSGVHFGQKNTHHISDFGNGVLACIVATPCSAPFMGTALAFALANSWWISLVIFSSLSIGMSLPYIIFCIVPRLVRLIPKPGKWMKTLRQVFGFCLIATALWLLSVLAYQIALEEFLQLFWALLILSIWAWGMGYTQHYPTHGMKKKIIGCFLIAGFALPIWYTVALTTKQEKVISIDFIPFDKEFLTTLHRINQPTLLFFSAKWCLTCIAQNKLLFQDASTISYLTKNNIRTVMADWTNYDKDVTYALRRYGRQSIPLYVLYKANAVKPSYIGTFMSKKIIQKHLEKND
jgi:thiol:disulfide interchange protein